MSRPYGCKTWFLDNKDQNKYVFSTEWTTFICSSIYFSLLPWTTRYNWWRPIAPSAIARRVIAVQTCSIIIITWHLVGSKIALQHILASLSTRPQSVVLRPRRLFQPQFSFTMKLPKDRREDKNLIKAKASHQFRQSGFTFFQSPCIETFIEYRA